MFRHQRGSHVISEYIEKDPMVGLDLRIFYAGPNDAVVIVTVRGYIDTTTSPDFSKLIEQQLGLGKYRFVMDLGKVDYISSTGWGVFIGNLKEVRDKGGDIVLANMVSGVHNIFTLMDLSSILSDYNSLDGALDHFIRGAGARRAAEGTPTSNKKQLDAQNGHYEKEARRKGDTEVPREGDDVSLHREKYVGPFGIGKRVPSERISDASGEAVGTPGHTGSELRKPSRRLYGSASKKRTPGPQEMFFAMARTDLGRRILRVIYDYPFYEIKEIGKALKLPEYGWKKASHRAIMNELRQMDFVDKKKRYDFVLRSRARR